MTVMAGVEESWGGAVSGWMDSWVEGVPVGRRWMGTKAPPRPLVTVSRTPFLISKTSTLVTLERGTERRRTERWREGREGGRSEVGRERRRQGRGKEGAREERRERE